MSDRVRVTAAIIRQNGRILLARRRKDSSLGGLWEFPGGKIEEGETAEECLARELKEEFEIECRVGRFVGSSSHDYPSLSIELLAYEVPEFVGDLRLQDHDEVSWVRPQDLLSLDLAPADVPIAQTLLDLAQQEVTSDER